MEPQNKKPPTVASKPDPNLQGIANDSFNGATADQNDVANPKTPPLSSHGTANNVNDYGGGKPPGKQSNRVQQRARNIELLEESERIATRRRLEVEASQVRSDAPQARRNSNNSRRNRKNGKRGKGNPKQDPHPNQNPELSISQVSTRQPLS